MLIIEMSGDFVEKFFFILVIWVVILLLIGDIIVNLVIFVFICFIVVIVCLIWVCVMVFCFLLFLFLVSNKLVLVVFLVFKVELSELDVLLRFWVEVIVELCRLVIWL